MQAHFMREFRSTAGELTEEEIGAARRLVASRYATPGWIYRLA